MFFLSNEDPCTEGFLGIFDLSSQFIWGYSLDSEGLHSAHFKYPEIQQAYLPFLRVFTFSVSRYFSWLRKFKVKELELTNSLGSDTLKRS